MSKHITGEAHITLPRFALGSVLASVEKIADWKRHPWKIRTDELHYKNERISRSVSAEVNPDLLASIKENGIVNPLLVIRGFDGRVYVWLGNQRLAAARELGIDWVPCIAVENEEDIKAAVATYKEC